MNTDFKSATHMIVLSDIHLSDAEPFNPDRPLWKKYKSRDLFIDDSFQRFLEYIVSQVNGEPIELVLNGDIFDFDSILQLPEVPQFPISWLERHRGLDPLEEKSLFKLSVIIRDHPVWFKALRDFLMPGKNRLVFIIGNHDCELHWNSLQKHVIGHLDLPEKIEQHVRFCEWFYISNQDTLIEHTHQYDAYNMCMNPINPTIKMGRSVWVRLPFGNLANKYIVNGIGLINPHVESSYIMSIREYIQFFTKYLLRVQPLLFWTWFWGACVTLVYSVREGLHPALRDPLTQEKLIEDIAKRANSTPRIVRELRSLHVYPAVYRPWILFRELWLDRLILFFGVFFISFQIFSTMRIFSDVSSWWFLTPMMLLLPLFLLYARSVKSDVYRMQRVVYKKIPLCATITGVSRIIQGHSHRHEHFGLEGIEILNSGTWSPAYKDVECTDPYGQKCFVWIKKTNKKKRECALFEWQETGIRLIPEHAPPTHTVRLRIEKIKRIFKPHKKKTKY